MYVRARRGSRSKPHDGYGARRIRQRGGRLIIISRPAAVVTDTAAVVGGKRNRFYFPFRNAAITTTTKTPPPRASVITVPPVETTLRGVTRLLRSRNVIGFRWRRGGAEPFQPFPASFKIRLNVLRFILENHIKVGFYNGRYCCSILTMYA